MAIFLFKTEPSTYAFGDLLKQKRTTWDGVSNATALIHLRTVTTGDTVVIYHSGKDKAAIGLARVAKGTYADPKLDDPRRVVVDLTPVIALKRPIALAEIKADAAFKTLDLVKNSRLSVMPMSGKHLARLMELAAR